MTDKRAKELLKHIAEDKDYGAKMMANISLSESIYVVSKILKACLDSANENGKDTDANFFAQMIERYRPIVLEKIRKEKRVWVVYCETTGYPYDIDKDIFVVFDYINHKSIIETLEKSGFTVSLLEEDNLIFKNEIGHMYRNGFKSIRFIDGKCDPFIVSREELYDFSDFHNDDYITNPALQESMISFFQEFRKSDEFESYPELISKREDSMIKNILNAEYMVPCIKTETEEEIEISHPFVDLSERVKTEDNSPVISIPIFTDGYELDKCYEGNHETMLYKFNELDELLDEIGASGVLINCLGISYYMEKNIVKQVLKDKRYK